MRKVRDSDRFVWGLLALLATLFSLGGARADDEKKPAADKGWVYQTPRRPALPAVGHRDWVRNPVDAFILAKLEENKLTPTAEADRVTLVRRLYFDLIGLPPTPAEVDAFMSDPSPEAYEHLVDRLLASPQYGERWATYWLDLVRFAESNGFKSDEPRPSAWRYRDYVIRSLNEDKPYDRFLREQIAGDELYPEDPDALVATGYCRHFPDESNAVNLEQRRQEILTDITDTTAQAVLGLTVGCARCHDHKFDPITQKDYYRFQAFFAAVQPADVVVGERREVAEYRRELAEWNARTAALRKKLEEFEAPYKAKAQVKRMNRFPKEYQDAYKTPPEKRTPLQEILASMVAKQVEVPKDEVAKVMKPEVRGQWQDLSKQMTEMAALKPPPRPTAMGMTDVGPTAPTTYLLKRGEWRIKGEVVRPGYLSAIEDADAVLPASGPRGTTGRRAVLANWLTKPDNPLTARVLVNRLWQHHFGRGIVATPSDWGVQGEPATHPELLDWLATELVARGWSMKAIHRILVTSATYRQATTYNARAAGVDPENRLLWRMNRRRLEGEALRDALLAVAGRLNPKAGGPSVYPELPPELGKSKGGWPVSDDPGERDRRSVYVFVKRNLRYPLFSAFDAPDANEPCARRFQTTSAPQALMLLNSKLVRQLAGAFAGRVLGETGPNPTAALDRAWRVAFGRAPDGTERATLFAFLEREQKAAAHSTASGAGSDPFTAAFAELCHAVVNLNEFLYVD